MVVDFNHASGEGARDEFPERLCWPPGAAEALGVSGVRYFVALDALAFAASRFCPKRLCFLTCLQVGNVPSVVQILRRYFAEKEYVTRFGCERETETLDLAGFKKPKCQVLVYQVQ